MLRIGIIGSGFGVIGLLPAFLGVKGCKVVAVCAKPSQQLEKYLNRKDRLHLYTDWELMLLHEELDAVAIAVTPDAQFKIAKKAIEKGLHVFAEKPLAANLKQATELLAIAKKKRVTHAIDFMFPEVAAWKEVKRILDSERYGKLRHISVNWEWLSGNIKYNNPNWKTDIKKGGGALAFYFSHGLHYLEHFGGKIVKADAQFSYTPLSKTAESGFDMLGRFQSGATLNVHVSSSASGVIRHQISFECDNAVIALENRNAVVDNFEVHVYSRDGAKKLLTKDVTSKNGEDERVKMVRMIAARFVDACHSKKLVSPNFTDGVRVEELIARIRSKSKK